MRNLLEWINIFSKSHVMDWNKANPIHPKNRGIPIPKQGLDCKECQVCLESCPTSAIQKPDSSTLSFDYGKCLQCGECSRSCPQNQIQDSGLLYAFALDRSELQIHFSSSETLSSSPPVTENIQRFQSLTERAGFLYREVVAGGNNSVECELNASFNSVFDAEREGIRAVASPKHADALVFSGPISSNMEGALKTAWEVMPEPKALIACGTEACSGGLFAPGNPPKTPDLWIAGDPPRPDTILQAFRLLLGRISFSFPEAVARARR